MINHYRTILLNIDGTNSPGLSYPGEELIDIDFKSKKLPTHLSTVRRLLFGENPDRAYLNYRLKQYTTLWHDSILHEATLDDDPRLTYWPLKYSADMSKFGTVSVEGINTQDDISYSYLKTPTADDRAGRAEFIYEISVVGDSCVIKDEKTKENKVVYKSGSYFDLGNDIRLVIDNGHWRVTAFASPAKDLGDILADCNLLRNSEVEFLLFLNNMSLKDLWTTSEFLPERLGAISLALAIEMNKLYEAKVA